MATAALTPTGGDVQSRETFPAQNAVAITKSDSTLVAFRAVFIGTAGDMAVLPLNGDTAVTFKNLAAGSILPVSVRKVMSTNTTASDMVGLV